MSRVLRYKIKFEAIAKGECRIRAEDSDEALEKFQDGCTDAELFDMAGRVFDSFKVLTVERVDEEP